MCPKRRISKPRSGEDLGADLRGAQDKDFSGLDFHNRSIRCQTFFESTFNGCILDRILATQSIFQHAEFTETQFSECLFEDTSFDHSDFVLADISGSEFIRCSFQNAEWRDASFHNVRFRQCIFRNTTTSLTHFKDCFFDEASAASFVGTTKRFSLFSGTDFYLPHEETDFLRANFGLESKTPVSLPTIDANDHLFDLSLRRFAGILTAEGFHRLILSSLSDIIGDRDVPHRLSLRYVAEICKVCVEEGLISVFGIQLLHAALSREASTIRNRDEGLELLSLVLALRLALREGIEEVEEQLRDIPHASTQKLRLLLEFDDTYDRAALEDYLDQMATYCQLPATGIVIERLTEGSTIVDVAIVAATYVTDIFRFIKYSLSLATVTLTQAGKLRKEYSRLTEGAKAKASKPARQSSKNPKAQPAVQLAQHAAAEIIGTRLESVKPIEVFVDTSRERVLVVGGKVRVTIILA
jgi:pentapeptide repeat protein